MAKKEAKKLSMEEMIAQMDAAKKANPKHLLAASMRLMEVGTKALGAGNKEDAYAMFEKSYDLYSLFWGLNMHLIDLGGVHEQIPAFYEAVIVKKDSEKKDEKKPENAGKNHNEKTDESAVKRLGKWVKNKVNCCIE